MRFLLMLVVFGTVALVGADSRAVAVEIAITRVKKGFVKVRPDLQVYTETISPKAGQPTVILLNGLTYSTKQWTKYVNALVKIGVGVVSYDMRGMGQTLLKYGPALEVISYNEQVKDLKSLLVQLKIPPPYNLVGLSYGGGIGLAYAAAYSADIRNLILLAPFTEPLAQSDQWIKSQVALTSGLMMSASGGQTNDQLYDSFLHQTIYATYPASEPTVLENPYKLEAIFRMVQGIRKFKAVDSVNKLPQGTVHLVIAGNDQYIPRKVLLDFWKAVPKSVRRSISVILNSEHKIPEAVPNFLAAYTAEIVRGNALFSRDRSFSANPNTGLVEFVGGQLQLSKESH